METLRCKMCGGIIEIDEKTGLAVCEYCGTKQTVPKINDEKLTALFERANFYRSKNEFDKALAIYEGIIIEVPEEAEAYWGICLCRYGIEYVTDPKTGSHIPTCHRTQFRSILNDESYHLAMKNADSASSELYYNEAHIIDRLQKNILSISSKEEPFDIFICYKETDTDGRRTVDSKIAENIYNRLTGVGYRVFFSRITLEDKIGTAYEPYIFAAINSSKIMLVVGTNTENFNSVWVKNEWSRFLSLIEKGEEKTLVPCYKSISPYELPVEFAALQAQDMEKIGAVDDLIRGIRKIIGLPGKNSNNDDLYDYSSNNESKTDNADSGYEKQPDNKKSIIFCKYCGAKFADDALYCPNCGQSINKNNYTGRTAVSDNSVSAKTDLNKPGRLLCENNFFRKFNYKTRLFDFLYIFVFIVFVAFIYVDYSRTHNLFDLYLAIFGGFVFFTSILWCNITYKA